MKNSFIPPSIMLGLAIAQFAQPLRAEALGFDPVSTGTTPALGEYTVASIQGQNPVVAGFTGAWVNANVSATATGLTRSAPNYLAASGGALQHTANGRTYRAMDEPLVSAFEADGTVYWTFLAKFGTAADNSPWGGYAAVEVGSNAANDNGKTLAIGVQDSAVPGNFMYQINNGAKVSLATASDTGTHLFVVRIDLSTTTASDSITLWIDPDLSGGFAADPAGGVVVSGLDLLPISNLRFAGGTNSFADEIRFGTTLESAIEGPDVPLAPTFLSHPTEYFGFVGATVTLSASAPADPAPTYQWERSQDGLDPWVEVEGAESSIYEIPVAPYTANGYYRAVATNSNGSATSDAALVFLIFPPPTITRQPTSVFAAEGSNVELSVEATGIGALSYQWFKDFSELEGETSATLTLEGIGPDDVGEYYVDVFDSAAEEIGEDATLATSNTVVVETIEEFGYDPVSTGSDPSGGEYVVDSIQGQDPVVSGFTGAWANPGVSASATGLTYPAPNNLVTSGGAFQHTAAGRPYRTMDGPLTSAFAADGTVYWSFLAKFGTAEDNTAWGGYAAVEVGSNAANDNGKALAIGIDNSASGNFMYQINNGAKVSLGTASDTGTHLVVVRFDLSTTVASDSVTIWVDPDLSSGLASDPPGGVNVSGSDLLPINNLRFGAGGANSFADEVRFGTTLDSVIPPGSSSLSFGSWIASYPGVGGQTGFNDDADRDGISNGVEYYFGTDPGQSNPGITHASTIGNTLTFRHPRNSAATGDVDGDYRWSVDLANWHADGATSVGTTVAFAASPDTPSAGTTTVTATISGTPRAKLFVDLKVGSAP